MSLSALTNIASLISSVAVLLSLVYLALQVRQTERNQRAMMDRGRSQQVSQWLQFIAQPEISPLVLRGHALDPTLTEDEKLRYRWCIYPLLLHYEDSFYQHREGMLGDAQYTSTLNHMKNSATTPGFRAAWGDLKDRFPPEFAAFFNGLIQAATPPGSSPS